jgi:signal peptidase II
VLKLLIKLFEILKKESLVFFIFFFTVLIDQASKHLIIANKLLFYKGIELLSWFNLVYVENKGISFGILSEFNISFYLGIISFLVSFYIIYLIKNSNQKKEKVALSLILGGAVGNGIDRITNNYVVDFIDLYFNDFHWPAFNFADSFITIGGILYFWLILFKNNE